MLKGEKAMQINQADVAELVDARDLKSLDGNVVWVRVPPPAPRLKQHAKTNLKTNPPCPPSLKSPPPLTSPSTPSSQASLARRWCFCCTALPNRCSAGG